MAFRRSKKDEQSATESSESERSAPAQLDRPVREDFARVQDKFDELFLNLTRATAGMSAEEAKGLQEEFKHELNSSSSPSKTARSGPLGRAAACGTSAVVPTSDGKLALPPTGPLAPLPPRVDEQQVDWALAQAALQEEAHVEGAGQHAEHAEEPAIVDVEAQDAEPEHVEPEHVEPEHVEAEPSDDEHVEAEPSDDEHVEAEPSDEEHDEVESTYHEAEPAMDEDHALVEPVSDELGAKEAEPAMAPDEGWFDGEGFGEDHHASEGFGDELVAAEPAEEHPAPQEPHEPAATTGTHDPLQHALDQLHELIASMEQRS